MSLYVMYIDIGNPNDLIFAPHISGTNESVCVLTCISSWYVAYICALCIYCILYMYIYCIMFYVLPGAYSPVSHFISITMTSQWARWHLKSPTSRLHVYSVVYSDADQRKHQSSASLAFVRGIHRWPVNSPHKWPVTRKMFPFDDVSMSFRNKIVSYSLYVYQLKFYEWP